MGRAPCCDKANVKKGPWSPEEDIKLKDYIDKYGTGGNWIALPHKAGLKRCGKSCRLRWLNYLRPNIKHGDFSEDEERIICSLFASIGSRWSIIAAQLPGRTDNDIKNYWNTKLKKKLLGIPQVTQRKPHQHHLQREQKQSHNHQQFLYDHQQESSCFTTAPAHPKPLLLTGLEGLPLISQEMLETTMHHHQHNYQMNMESTAAGSLQLVFGGDQSCSSSDGSCTQILDRYDLFTGHPPLEYSYEEIKQLVSPNTFYVDHDQSVAAARQDISFNLKPQSQERVMYYY